MRKTRTPVSNQKALQDALGRLSKGLDIIFVVGGEREIIIVWDNEARSTKVYLDNVEGPVRQIGSDTLIQWASEGFSEFRLRVLTHF